jgi:hypothetical protein
MNAYENYQYCLQELERGILNSHLPYYSMAKIAELREATRSAKARWVKETKETYGEMAWLFLL